MLASVDGEREVDLADYFTGYRTTVRRPDELIRAVRIPLPLAQVTAFHKIAKRRFDDISSVAVAFALDLDDGVVAAARIGLGGVAATPIRARATEARAHRRSRGTSRPSAPRHPCWAPRARRCPTIGRAPSTARSCSSSALLKLHRTARRSASQEAPA